MTTTSSLKAVTTSCIVIRFPLEVFRLPLRGKKSAVTTSAVAVVRCFVPQNVSKHTGEMMTRAEQLEFMIHYLAPAIEIPQGDDDRWQLLRSLRINKNQCWMNSLVKNKSIAIDNDLNKVMNYFMI